MVHYFDIALYLLFHVALFMFYCLMLHYLMMHYLYVAPVAIALFNFVLC